MTSGPPSARRSTTIDRLPRENDADGSKRLVGRTFDGDHVRAVVGSSIEQNGPARAR